MEHRQHVATAPPCDEEIGWTSFLFSAFVEGGAFGFGVMRKMKVPETFSSSAGVAGAEPMVLRFLNHSAYAIPRAASPG